jgi:D-aminoacyl-tRNA deacylase
VYFGNRLLLLEREGLHLYLDGIDREIRSFLDEGVLSTLDVEPEGDHPLDLLVFLSKHRSEREIDSLTVHPPGNYLSADHGGIEGFLPPSAPHEMTSALKSLYKEKKDMGIRDQTTYEVTHHGPLVESPCFFIEIGSGPDRWDIPILGKAIGEALLSDTFLEPRRDLPVAIGIGGGHYAPRFTDRAMRNKYSFGHMIADYILNETDDIGKPLELASRSTPDASVVMAHRSKSNVKLLKGLEKAASELGLEVV